jgi:hypothetical protein
MGIISELVIAKPDAARAVCESDEPLTQYAGFTFKGLDNIKLATLLSLISCGSAGQQYEQWLAAVPMSVELGEDGPWAFALTHEAVETLASVASIDGDQFDQLATAWSSTEEFSGWQPDDTIELLRLLGDTAETATLNSEGLILRMAL